MGTRTVGNAPEAEPGSATPGRLRTFVRRVPIVDVLGLFASCLVVIIAFSPILFGGRTLSAAGKGAAGTNGTSAFPGQPAADYSADYRPDQGASTWALEPWAEVTHRAFSEGDLPLWNAYQGAGAPLAANMQSAVFDPLFLPVNLHPTPRVWDYTIVGAFVLGAAAAYLFARVVGLRVVPSVVVATANSLSGFYFLYSNNSFSRSYIYLPILFLFVELVVKKRQLWPVFGLGVAVAANIYVGMPEASFFVIGAAAIYAIARVVHERSTSTWRATLARLGVGGFFGLLLASPLLLLFRQYESLSFSAHESGSSAGELYDPLWGLLNWIVPFFHGVRGQYNAPGLRNWFGVAVLIAALIALSGRKETKRLHAWLFFALGAFVLLKVYGSGPFRWIGSLPVAERVIFGAWGPPVVAFAFAMLAGIGVQVLWNHDLHVRRFLTLLASTAVLLTVLVSTGDRWTFITMPSGQYVRGAWGRATLFGLLVLVAALFLSRVSGRWAAVLVACVILTELLVLAPFDIYAKRADPYATPGWMPLAEIMQRAEPESRVFALDAKLFPNSAGALGLQDVRMLDALYVDRYFRYIQTFVQPTITTRFIGGMVGSDTETGDARYESNPMFDALAVRTFLTERDLGSDPALRFIGQDREIRVYENTSAYPRAWLVHDVHVVDDEDDAFEFLEASGHRENGAVIVDRFDPRNEAVVETGGEPDPVLASLQDGATSCDSIEDDDVTVLEYSADAVKLSVDAACAGLLVLPDTYFPGWTSKVNGDAHAIYATDGAFRGVTVPAGTSVVEFHYRPRLFSVGAAIAATALVGFAIAAVVLALLRRNRTRRTETEASAVYPERPHVS